MILLIHCKDLLLSKFANYLKDNGVEHMNVNLGDMVNNTYVNAKLTNKMVESSWQFQVNDLPICLDNFNAIYHNLSYPTKDMFNLFENEDIDYCRSEWFGYLIYELSRHNNCFNPVCPSGFFNPKYSLPYLYKLANELNFNTPEYILFPKKEILKNISSEYCFKQSIYDFTDYSINYNSLKSPQIALRLVSGAKVLANFSGNKYFANIQYQDCKKNFDLSPEIVEKCQALLEKLNLRICQLFFMCTPKGDLILYHLNPSIKYNHVSNDIELFFNNMLKGFNNAYH